MRAFSKLLLVSCCLLSASAARADDVSVAVAANFLGTLEKLAPLFEKSTGHKLQLSPGASGQLYAQIKAGAPYDVLLSADAQRPAQLAKEGLAIDNTRFVYAQGKLVLWSAKPSVVDSKGAILTSAKLEKLALADPQTAPYGAAAQQTLQKLTLWEKLNGEGKLVLGTSVAQAHQFVDSGNASCGFVALSQVLAGKRRGSYWLVPQALYAPLQQEAVLLKSDKPAARAFLSWLKTHPKALAAIKAAGYSAGSRTAPQAASATHP